MFSGKGDSSKLKPDELQTLAHIRRLGETGHLVIWDERKSESASRAVQTYERWEGTLAVGNSIRNMMLLISFFLAVYWFAGDTIAQILNLERP